ncbi:MAG: hypothetical protein AAF560_27055 [Acidobacteriota bacterium]
MSHLPNPSLGTSIRRFNLAMTLLVMILAGCLIAPSTFGSPTSPSAPLVDPLPLAPMDETDELGGGSTNLAPMDETDELGGGSTNLAPMDETDELGSHPHRWFEVAGSGLLEIGDRPRHHPWCPWTETALSPTKCARQLVFDSSRRLVLQPASSAGSEVVGLRMAASGLVFITIADATALAGEVAPAFGAFFDRDGHWLGDLEAGTSLWVEAGNTYLRVEDWPRSTSIELDIVMD